METKKIEAWMFRSPNEFWALFLSLLITVIIGFLFSLINVYIVIILVLFYLIYVKMQQSKYLGNAIRVHQKQYPEIYEIFKEYATQLGIRRASLYIIQDPYLNASTIGLTTCTVILNSALIEALDIRELSFVIGHELGHFKAGHTKISTLIQPLGNGNIFANLLFGFWQRKTEYTGDRCGLALTKDINACLTALIKISLGGSNLFEKFDIQGYLAQLKIADSTNVKLSEIVTLSNHPYLVNRLKNVLLYWKENFKKR